MKHFSSYKYVIGRYVIGRSLLAAITMGALSGVLAACGSGTSFEADRDWDPSTFDKVHADALSRSRTPFFLATHLRVRGLNSGVVAISMLQPDGTSGVCSGSLISPQQVLTNRHCIPEDLNMAQAACAGRVFVSIPGIETVDPEFGFKHNRAIHCKSIDYATQNIENQPEDLAILTLAEPVPAGLVRPIHLRELQDGERVTVNRVNFIQDDPAGRWTYQLTVTSPDKSFTSTRPVAGQLVIAQLDTLNCEIMESSRLIPEHFTAASTRYALGRCPVIRGNSGSLITDAQGSGVAVLFGGNTQDLASRIRALIFGGVAVEGMGAAINLACGSPEFQAVLGQFAPQGERQTRCRAPKDPDLDSARSLAEQARLLRLISRFAQAHSFLPWLNPQGLARTVELGGLVVEQMEAHAARNPDDIFTLTRKNYMGRAESNHFYLPSLKCLRTAEKVLSQTQKSFLFIKWQPTSTQIELPPVEAVQLVGVKLDSNARLQPEMQSRSLEIRTKIEIDANQLEKTGTTPYRWILGYNEQGVPKEVTAPGGILNTCL